MKKIILAGAMMLGATSAFCQDWINITSNDTTRYDGRAGTRLLGKTKAGTPMVIAQGRVFNTIEKSYSYQKWYVSLADCKAGYGKLIVLKLDGEFYLETDFVENGGSVGSAIAEMLCTPVKEQIGKGI